jgi:ABC-type multidrug transport system ATPase subunit
MDHFDVRGLAKAYGGGRGLEPLSFQIRQGESVGIVGHNGAGKSTLLKMAAGWIRPDQGDVFIDGFPSRDRLRAVRKLAFLPETPSLFEQFSVDYNLRLFARLFALPRSRVEAILEEFDLLALRRARVSSLSKGLKQRVSIGRCLLADPSILLFDEPTSGLDFEFSKEVHARVKSMHGQGKTVVFTSHRPEEIETLATRVLVLHHGAVVFDGTPPAYLQSKLHRDLYQ